MSARGQPTSVQVGDLHIDRLRFEVKIRNTEVRLTRKEFALLWLLASEDGRVFHREELIEQLWDPHVFVNSRAVDVHIARLRRKLRAASGLSLIETVWGIGYRLKGRGVIS
jgi:two-component system alkaline phosphatase synthesis response regulator PhoP